jgi:hypothetical protein
MCKRPELSVTCNGDGSDYTYPDTACNTMKKGAEAPLLLVAVGPDLIKGVPVVLRPVQVNDLQL